jgi:hypothetical protein
MTDIMFSQYKMSKYAMNIYSVHLMQVDDTSKQIVLRKCYKKKYKDTQDCRIECQVM